MKTYEVCVRMSYFKGQRGWTGHLRRGVQPEGARRGQEQGLVEDSCSRVHKGTVKARLENLVSLECPATKCGLDSIVTLRLLVFKQFSDTFFHLVKCIIKKFTVLRPVKRLFILSGKTRSWNLQEGGREDGMERMTGRAPVKKLINTHIAVTA